jgi:hypothetical protein
MVGCDNEIGFLPANKEVFEDGKLPSPGSIASLGNYVYLRLQAVSALQGPWVLGPGTRVKVLEYVKSKHENTEFAVVRVVESKNTRQEECPSTIRCKAKFY